MGAGLSAIDTRKAILQSVSLHNDLLKVAGVQYDLKVYKQLYILGAGKCAGTASEALEEILGDRISGGLALTIGSCPILRRIKGACGDHPMPTERNVQATEELLSIAKCADENDLVLMIVSGGGSTLLCQPDSHTCQSEAELLKCLFRKGATINEINIVRKHLSLARGGYLAKMAYPATLHALIFSDVPGNDISSVASGPTTRDLTTTQDARKILTNYATEDSCGFDGESLIETPKEDIYFAKTVNSLIVSNNVALLAMLEQAKVLGYDAKIMDDKMEGEARDRGSDLARQIKEGKRGEALLYGGETTVTLRGEAKDKTCTLDSCGGRNRELALSALSSLGEDTLVLALASDGRDNGDMAGAIADKPAIDNAQSLGLNMHEYLDGNASGTFFQKIGAEVYTGDTGSNVSDLTLSLKSK